MPPTAQVRQRCKHLLKSLTLGRLCNTPPNVPLNVTDGELIHFELYFLKHWCAWIWKETLNDFQVKIITDSKARSNILPQCSHSPARPPHSYT